MLTGVGDEQRWLDSGWRQGDSSGDMRLGFLPRNPLRAPGERESAWAACGAGTWVCATKAKCGPHARVSRELGKSLRG
jgi:hypothetical protein